MRGLGVQPEAGLEVIVTGKITSYPARSSYHIVIESMEAAGAGALLAQLERLKVRLREEGLFEPGRNLTPGEIIQKADLIRAERVPLLRWVLIASADRGRARLTAMHELVIRNGLLVDGSGAPARPV